MSLGRCVEFLESDALDDGAVLGPELASGIFPLTLPLSFGPKTVNVWLLEDDGGWTIVDCGADTPEIRRIWSELIGSAITARSVQRILITHGHVDHIGHAGPLWDATCRPPFLVTRTEWLSAALRAASAGRQTQPHAGEFFRSHGVPESELAAFTALPGALGALAPLPDRYHRIVDGDMVRIGQRDWRVMTSGGHAPEHAALHCADEGLLISGDQVLPRITPFVGVFPTEPEADPLGEFLAALERFAGLAEDTLVLPSHGSAFRGLHARIAELRAHHEERLDQIEGLAATSTAYEIASRVFARAMATEHRRLALAETLAHLNLLGRSGRLNRDRTAKGVTTYRAR